MLSNFPTHGVSLWLNEEYTKFGTIGDGHSVELTVQRLFFEI
jgi:hypothetical protein